MTKKKWIAGVGLIAFAITVSVSPRLISRALAAARREEPQSAGFRGRHHVAKASQQLGAG